MPTKQNIVVVGAGAAGSLAVQQLAAKIDPFKHSLTVIDSRPYLFWMIAGARIVATDRNDVIESALIPYDRLLTRGKGSIKMGKVVEIDEKKGGKGGEVILENNEHIPYDGQLETFFPDRSFI
jgi:apoptosis-inducing factor 2